MNLHFFDLYEIFEYKTYTIMPEHLMHISVLYLHTNRAYAAFLPFLRSKMSTIKYPKSVVNLKLLLTSCPGEFRTT